MKIINIAGYKFITLKELDELRLSLMDSCTALALKGTILLSAEGINLSLAGLPEQMAIFKTQLQQDERFADMRFRESYSADLPFKYLRVKLRKEIITMGQPEVQPEVQCAPHVSPSTLKQWLDEKREITLLDTRNDYEVRFGTFENAVHCELEDFGEFPQKAASLDKAKSIVMFCTGGVRCEKAGTYLLRAGFSAVYQLEGGILNYFAEVGGAHYQGECFVFDQRIAVNAALQETDTVQCQVCQGPVREATHCTVNQCHF